MKLSITVLLFFITSTVFSQELDSCHSLLNIDQPYEKNPNAQSATQSIEELKELKTLSFSYNSCNDTTDPVITITSCRIIFVGADKPAAMMTSTETLSATYYTKLDEYGLQPGDRVIIEAIKYEIEGETYHLRPLVFTIE